MEKRYCKVWMTWENWGMYNAKTWVDNDYSTHTWNIDHIVPKTHFLCDSMSHPDLIKCWNIDNIRPLSAKQNIKDGNNREPEVIERIKKSIAEFLFFSKTKNG